MPGSDKKHTHSGHAGTQHPIYFRSWDFSGTVVNVDFLSAEDQDSVSMEGLPMRTPPGILWALNITAEPQVLRLKGEDDVEFDFVVPGNDGFDGAGGPGHLEPLPGGVNAIVATGSGTIDRVLAGWYQSGAQPRRKIG